MNHAAQDDINSPFPDGQQNVVPNGQQQQHTVHGDGQQNVPIPIVHQAAAPVAQPNTTISNDQRIQRSPINWTRK